MPRIATQPISKTHPHIAAEFHPSRNDFSADQVTFGSGKVAWWLGLCGHEWDMIIAARTGGAKQGCPYCAGVRVLVGFNDFATKAPNVAAMWHPSLNGFKPTDVVGQSAKKAWFICDLNHEWKAQLYSFTKNAHKGYKLGCPYCSNQRLLAGFNDLATTAPLLALQWHPTKNKLLMPTQIMKGSGKKVWWLGSCGHEWFAQINSRSRNGCSQCSKSGTSKIEVAFVDSLNIKLGWSLKPQSIKLFSKEYAVKVDGVTELANGSKIVFEYDGSRWHAPLNIIKRDTRKTEALLEKGYIVIRVREVNLSKTSLPFLDLKHPNLLQLSHVYDAHFKKVENDTDIIQKWIQARNE